MTAFGIDDRHVVIHFRPIVVVGGGWTMGSGDQRKNFGSGAESSFDWSGGRAELVPEQSLIFVGIAIRVVNVAAPDAITIEKFFEIVFGLQGLIGVSGAAAGQAG